MYTHLGTSLVVTEGQEQYDASVKNLLADPQIIAWILRGTTEEFYEMEIENIIPLIENPYVGQIPVTPGLANRAIEGLPTESKICDEGSVYYDVRFFVKMPLSDNRKLFRIIVDLEAQKNPNPGYSIPLRGIAYGSRMVSEQFGRNVVNGNYDDLEKVYSIWIVFNCSREKANTIVSYSVQPKVIYGDYKLTDRYDLMNVVLVNIPKEGDLEKAKTIPSELHKMLYDVFVDSKTAREKIKNLCERYNLVSETFERKVNVMCNLSEALVEDTMKKTKRITRMLDNGKTPEEISELTGYSISFIKSVQADDTDDED